MPEAAQRIASSRKSGSRSKIRLQKVGSLPIIKRFMELLKVEKLFERHLEAKHGHITMPYAKCLAIKIVNILDDPTACYELINWAAEQHAGLLGLDDYQPSALTDDRMGRALDCLFKADRATMLTELSLHMCKLFRVQLNQVHDDSTSISLYGDYENKKKKMPSEDAVKITYGHSKDHNPHLKQFLFGLTVSRDGAVPIHYRIENGNMTDDKTHISTYDSICQIVGNTKFIYVADSKLCTSSQMSHIHNCGGQFITVMPKNRAEYKHFRSTIERQGCRKTWTAFTFKRYSIPHAKNEHDLYEGYEHQ